VAADVGAAQVNPALNAERLLISGESVLAAEHVWSTVSREATSACPPGLLSLAPSK
jgi:hypothetical protein